MAVNIITQFQRMKATLEEWLGEDGLPSPHAQTRANTCLACPKHEHAAWEELYKGAVAEPIRRHMEMRSHLMLRVEGESELHLCGLCRCVMKLKVHVPLDVARRNTPDWHNFPDNCWLRTEQPTQNEPSPTTNTTP